jgi:hypothetical protein
MSYWRGTIAELEKMNKLARKPKYGLAGTLLTMQRPAKKIRHARRCALGNVLFFPKAIQV